MYRGLSTVVRVVVVMEGRETVVVESWGSSDGGHCS